MSEYIGTVPDEWSPENWRRAEAAWEKICPLVEDMTEPELEHIQAQIRDLLRTCYSYGESGEGAKNGKR